MASEAPKVVRLAPWRYPDQAAAHLQRTTDYAKDPKAYLIKTLGQENFDARKHLMCLPESTDADMYGHGKHKQHFEAHIGSLLGKQHTTFFITGVQAQNAALRAHCDRKGNNRVAWHGSSHLEIIEKRAWATLYQLERTLIGKDARIMPALEDIRAVVDVPEHQRPAVILIELPNRELGCLTWSWDDLVSINAMCKEAGVALHLDGARLWDIEPYYQETAGKSLSDIAALFDSVYVSLYKGLGGISAGCTLSVPDADFLKEVDIWRVRSGGNMFSSVFNIIDGERAFNENIGTFAEKKRIATTIISQINEATKDYQVDGKPIAYFHPDPPTCPQFQPHFYGFSEKDILAAHDRVQEKSGVRVFGGVRSWTNMQKILAGELEMGYGMQPETDKDEKHFATEFNIDSSNVQIPVETFVTAWTELCKELLYGR